MSFTRKILLFSAMVGAFSVFGFFAARNAEAQQQDPGVCTIGTGDVAFSPYANQTSPNLGGEANDEVSASVKLTLKTSNCKGKYLTVAINAYQELSDPNNAFEKRVQVQSDTLVFNFIANELPCQSSQFNDTPDCKIGVTVTNDSNQILVNTGDPVWIDNDIRDFYANYATDSQFTNNKGILYYFCWPKDGPCRGGFSHNWEALSNNDSGYFRVDLDGNVIGEAGITEFNTDSPCYDNDQNSPTYGKYKPGCNALLAPLPGLSVIDDSVSLGQYINIVIRLAIGLVVVFAVVMLVSYGVQYMTQGSVTGKADSKEKIKNALVGVLIALGIFVILATINPNLLNLEPNIDEVSISKEAGSTTDSEFYNVNNIGETGAGCKALEDSLLEGERFDNNAERVQAIRAKDTGSANFLKISGESVFAKDKARVLAVMNQTITAGPFKGNTVLIESIYNTAKSYNINPFLALAMWQSESSWGAKGAAATTHNIGNIRPGGSWSGQIYTSPASGRFRDYNKTYGGSPKSWEESIKAYFELLKNRYVSQGYDSVQEIIPMYAPCSDKNNTLNYINNVANRIKTAEAKI